MTKKYSKRIILIVALLLLSFFLLSCSDNGQKGKEERLFGPTFNVGEIIVNLADIGQARYAKAEVVLELSNDSALEEVQLRSPQIRDIVIEIFSSQQASVLLDLEGKEEIKNKIMARINPVLTSGSVEEVYFTTIVVQ